MTSAATLAAALRQAIDAGEYQAGDRLPTNPELMTQYGVSKATVTKAINGLAADGIVVTARRGGTRVRHRTPVRLSVARYSQVTSPGGTRGPWETATHAQGMSGEMRLVTVQQVRSPDIAALLGVPLDTELVHRYRHAVITPDDVVQVQHAWYPADLASSAGIDGTAKIVGGVYGALAAAGRHPATAGERVQCRPPTEEEASELRIGGRVPVVAVERITRDASGTPIEIVRTAAPADRLEYTYEDLPLTSNAA